MRRAGAKAKAPSGSAFCRKKVVCDSNPVVNMRFFKIQKQKQNKTQCGRVNSNIFRRRRGEVASTFGFVRGPVLSAALRNVLEAKIAQNLVEVGGVDEHVLNGEALHGARSVPTLAARLQPPVESGLGAAAFDAQTRRGAGVGVRGAVGGWSESGGCGSETEENKKWEFWSDASGQVCVRFHAAALRSVAAAALTCGRAFLRDHTAFCVLARPRPSTPHPSHTHTPSFFLLMVACDGSGPGGPFFFVIYLCF